MAPAGYLGRRFADQHRDLALPPRILDWSDDHRLLAVARRGPDMPGDLIVGQESLDLFFQNSPREASPGAYVRLAELSAEGGASSSAGGEHPKFAAYRGGRHLLVKFTTGDGSPTDLRWRDLLATEALALDVLRAHGISAATARVVDRAPRRFLEIERFDRIGARGRRGVLSLGPLDDDLYRFRDTWTDAAARFATAGLLGQGDARTVRLLEAFGILISNGDRHFGNLSFFGDALQERPSLVLAPAYDMLPMDVAPRAGLLPELQKTKPVARASLLDVWDDAERLAVDFWQRVAQDPRISKGFREAASGRAR